MPITSNVRWVEAPGNVFLRSKTTGLPKDSVANVSQIIAIDRAMLTERAGRISRPLLTDVLAGIDIILGR